MRARPERSGASCGFGISLGIWLGVVVALAGTFAAPSRASAAEAPPSSERGRVLLLTDTPGDPLMAQIRGELVGLGLEVLQRPADGEIPARARAEHARAAIRMLPSGNGVEVWTAEENSGRPLLRQAIVDDKPGGPDRALIALETAEVLRTSFFPRPPRANQSVLTPIAPAPRTNEVALALGVGLVDGGAGSTASWQAWLSFQDLWTEHLGAALALSAPVVRGSMRGPEGTADVGAVTAGLEVVARAMSPKGRVFASAGGGASFVALLTTGHPSTETARLVGGDSAAYTGAAHLRLAVGWRTSRWLSLGVQALAGGTFARVPVRFAGNEAGTWGLPLLGACVFVELGRR